MRGPEFQNSSAPSGSRSADEQRIKSRKFIGLAATCLILITCLAYVSHLFSGQGVSLYSFSGLILFLLFIIVVDRILAPQIGGLPAPELASEPTGERLGQIRMLLDGLPAGHVVVHDVPTLQGTIDHLVFRKDGAVFLIEVRPDAGKLLGPGFAGLMDEKTSWLRNQLKTRLGCEPIIHAVIVPAEAGFNNHFKVHCGHVVSKDSLLHWMQQSPGDPHLAAIPWSQVGQLKSDLARPASIHLAPLVGLR